MFIIFNEEAQKLYADKFAFLQNISQKNLTLKFISDLLIYLFEIDIKNKDNQDVFYTHNSFKNFGNNFIMGSDDLDGSQKIQTFFNYKGSLKNSQFTEQVYKKNDTSLNLWLLKNYLENNNLDVGKKLKRVFVNIEQILL